ncbi:MAG: putative metalloprotease CJM1_0395 family protein [Planctomycetota bacterium]
MQIAAFQSEITPILRPAGAPIGDRAGEGIRVVASSPADPSRGNDAVEISPEARDASDRDAKRNDDPSTPKDRNGEPLSEADQRKVEKLKARDQEVRTHEQAHVAAAGALYRGGPNYSYRTGPDGNRYAVGGSVQIDTSEASTPEETITKAQQIRRAALAPQEPSSTDQAVAAKASRMEAQARAELAAEQAEGNDGEESTIPANAPRNSDGSIEGGTQRRLDVFA